MAPINTSHYHCYHNIVYHYYCCPSLLFTDACGAVQGECMRKDVLEAEAGVGGVGGGGLREKKGGGAEGGEPCRRVMRRSCRESSCSLLVRTASVRACWRHAALAKLTSLLTSASLSSKRCSISYTHALVASKSSCKQSHNPWLLADPDRRQS